MHGRGPVAKRLSSVYLTMSLRLGVDVGGTNTDAVLLKDDIIIGSAKRCSSADVLSGIQGAVQAALIACSAGGVTKTPDWQANISQNAY